MLKKLWREKREGWLFISVALILFLFFSLYPIIDSLILSFYTSRGIVYKFNGFGNIKRLFDDQMFYTSLKNTMIYLIIQVPIMLVLAVFLPCVTSLAAYGFDKFKSIKTEIIYKIFLLSMMVPFAAMMIPLFRIMVKLSLIDSLLAVILPGLSSVFLIFFFRQSLKSFPTQIIESARIDGASELTIFFRIFFRIVLPPMKPTLAAAIYAFMTQWNNYMWPLIVLRTNESKTLTLTLSSMSSAYFVDYGMLMLAIVISTIPMIVIFFSMQKSFVQGMTGSCK